VISNVAEMVQGKSQGVIRAIRKRWKKW